jgi:hypothetical protein
VPLNIKVIISLYSNPSQTESINTPFETLENDDKQPRTTRGTIEIHVGGHVSV